MSLETMTKLASTTVGVGGIASVAFSNIPQGYTDLRVVISARTSRTNDYGDDINVTFNSNATGYSGKSIMGFGSGGISSLNGTTTAIIRTSTSSDSNTANTFGNFEMHVSNYTSSAFKSVSIDTVGENNATTAMVNLTAGLWSNPSPITYISFTPGVGPNFMQHSTFTLYGIKNARQTAGNSIKATGGNIVFDGTYVYHVFNATSSFTPTQPIYADYLVVAGGGGGGSSTGGGGGAGGYRTTTGTSGGGASAESKLSLSPMAYAVVIGAGGAGGASSQRGTQGSESSFSTIASTGGGAGSGTSGGQSTPTTGGSGGGGFGLVSSGAAGTTNQGFAGGNGLGGSEPAGGGGGAGGVGGNAPTTSQSGNGGVGLSFSLGDRSLQLAGGGGGGGLGASTVVAGTASFGGGAGAQTSGGGTPGTTNTGGGGGGGYWSGSAAAAAGTGGSGVVIIRYKG